MAGGITALRFIKGSTIGPVWEAPQREITLEGAPGSPPADVYEPPGRPRGTLVFVHGMTFRAHRDQRQMRACRVLAGAGFRVVAPLIPDLASVRVSAEGMEQVAGAIAAVAEDPALSPEGRVGVFSVSYSAALCLIAAATPRLKGRVSGLCALGTFAHGLEWVRWIVEDDESDNYARLIFLRNFMGAVLGPRPAVEAALDACISDLNVRDEALRFPDALAALGAEDRALTERLRDDAAYQRSLGRAIIEAGACDIFRVLSPAVAAPRLSMPVALVHGATDRVVPPQESRELHRLLRERGVPSRLVITTLLTHGDTDPGLHAVRDAIDLVQTFAHFFGAVEAASRGDP